MAPESAVPDTESAASRRVQVHTKPVTPPSGSANVAVRAAPALGASDPNVTAPASSTLVTLTVTAMVSSVVVVSAELSAALPSCTDTVTEYELSAS